jgi:hypothetical protein
MRFESWKDPALTACVSRVPRACGLLVGRGQMSSVPVPKQLRLPEECMRLQVERPQQDLNTDYQLDSQCFAQIGADRERHNCPSLSKARPIENVKEKWLTGYGKLSDHVFRWLSLFCR